MWPFSGIRVFKATKQIQKLISESGKETRSRSLQSTDKQEATETQGFAVSSDSNSRVCVNVKRIQGCSVFKTNLGTDKKTETQKYLKRERKIGGLNSESVLFELS